MGISTVVTTGGCCCCCCGSSVDVAVFARGGDGPRDPVLSLVRGDIIFGDWTPLGPPLMAGSFFSGDLRHSGPGGREFLVLGRMGS